MMVPDPAIPASLRRPERTVMRTVRHVQMEIGEARTGDIEPAPKSRDDSGHRVAGKKPGAPLHGCSDSFCVETGVHYPTDVH